MSVKSYYRAALVLPLLVPVLASPLMLLTPFSAVLAIVMMFLFWSVLIGGIPYVLFAAGFLLWMRRAPEERVRAAILLSPLIYAAVLGLCFIAFLAVDGTMANSGEAVGLLMMYGVLFGYGYVALAELGRMLFRPGAPPAVPAPVA